jgi:hypothetical protein
MRSKKGRFLRGHGKVTRKRAKRRNPAPRARRRAKRRNPGMPIMLVNPSGSKRRRRVKRHNPSHARRSRRRVRRNPSSSWMRSFSALGLGALGGGIMAGVDWGCSMIPTSATWQIASVAGAGAVLSIVASKWGDERVGAGAAGAAVLSLVRRGTEAYALSSLAVKPAATGTEVQTEAGRVFRDAGAFMRERGANSMAPSGNPRAPSFREAGAVFREAGASRYVDGPVRLFGPRSWAYGSDAGAVYRSAHNSAR